MAGGTLGGSATTSAAARLALAAAASPSRPAAPLTRSLILTITATAAGSRATAHQFGQREQYRQGYHALEEQKRHQPTGAYGPPRPADATRATVRIPSASASAIGTGSTPTWSAQRSASRVAGTSPTIMASATVNPLTSARPR